MTIPIDDPKFWSKLGLPFVSTPSGERMKSMWVSTLPRKEPVITLHKNSDEYLGEDTLIRIIGRRIVYEVTEIGKQRFCPISNDDDEDEDFKSIHGGIVEVLLSKHYIFGTTDLILMTDSFGFYKGITLMEEKKNSLGDKYWHIDYVCTSDIGKLYASKMITQIQQQLENNQVKYIRFASFDDKFYKKNHGFVHVYDYKKKKYNTFPCIKNASDLDFYKDDMIYCLPEPVQPVQPDQPLPQPKFKVGDIVELTEDIQRLDYFMKPISPIKKGTQVRIEKIYNGKDGIFYDIMPPDSGLTEFVAENKITLVEYPYTPNHALRIIEKSEFNIPSKYIKFVNQQYQFLHSLSKREVDILKLYTRSGDRIINQVLRSNVTDEKEENQVLHKALKDFMTIYKGGSLFQESSEEIKNIGIGKIRAFVNEFLTVFKKVPVLKEPITVYRGVQRAQDIHTHGNEFLSTSMLRAVAEKFTHGSKCCDLTITIHPGVRALFIAPISSVWSEYEVLIGPPYNVTKKSVTNLDYTLNIYPISSKGGHKTRRNKKQKQTRRN